MSEKGNISNENLTRALQERHIQLIAIGGAIGVGLFLGSNSAIRTAGPALLLSYLIGGIIIFSVMRALGEVAVDYPVSGSFSAYANIFIGPRAGFITGWTYWFVWIVTGMAEITAVGVYTNYWWPDLPQWIPALAALACMTGVNLASVKIFGEFEFWFALIKVVIIVAMIALGGYLIFKAMDFNNISASFKNLTSLEGGFMPYGMKGTVMALSMVMFAMVGIELIGVTAGEASDPQKSIPSAINKVLWRILIFYIGTLFIIMTIFPWNEIGEKGSPFVIVFKGLGIGPAAGIINFVVLTAALSSCNSGIFSNGRMVYTQALQGRAPAAFKTVNKHHIPSLAIIASSCVMLIGVLLNYIIPENVFIVVTSIATFAAIWIWGTIIVVQIASRKGKTPEEIAKLKFPTLFYPFYSYLGLIGLACVAVILCFNPDTRIAMVVGPIWIVALFIIYELCGFGKEDREQLSVEVA